MKETPRSNGHEERIFVSVRVRPLNEKERARHDVSEWECISPNTIQCKNTLPEPSFSLDAYTFDKVFGDGCSTQQVYEAGIKQVALSVLSGINSSVFAYGQTSSGKTYTMTGITEYAVRDIYDSIEMHQDREFVLKFSAMEIYNEIVRDLLSADNIPLRLLDDPRKGTVVEKLKEEILTERSHMQELLSICAAERTTKETTMNETSSRSHQILRLTIESFPSRYVGTNRSGMLVASVNFVDLAGSERASQALTRGTRLREGGHINRSLLTLGTVIRKLSQCSEGRNGHIPYRDSKLTRILQSSLGGNARTAIICTISPTRSHVEQSKNTLFFAGCAKQVTTNAQVNDMMSDKILVKHLQKELARMENELRSFAPNTVLLKERELQIEQMDKKIKELTRERDIFQSHFENLLQSEGKDQLLIVHKDTASESSGFTSNLHLDMDLRTGNASENPNEPRHIESMLNKNLFQQPENPEDNFLLDGNTPEFIGPDPCQGWEEIASRVDAGYGDNCKEVHCIEDYKADVNLFVPASEDIGGKSPMRLVKNGDAESSSRKEDNELIHVTVDNNQDVLQQKIEDLRRTIDRLGGLTEKFKGSSESYISPSRGLQFTRSRSCRPILSATSHLQFDQGDQEIKPRSQSAKLEFKVMLSPQLDQLEQKVVSPSEFNKLDKEPASPQFDDRPELKTMLLPHFKKPEEETITSPAKVKRDNSSSLPCFHDKLSERKFHAKKRKSSGEHFQTRQMAALDEVESVMDSDMEDTASVLNFVVKMNGRSKTTPSKDFDDLMVRPRTSGFNEMGKARVTSFHGVPGALLPSKFERQQRYMVELWDAYNVPLVHRSYYFLLIKGEFSDPMYLDIELRRLSFLRDKFSTGTPIIEDGQNLTADSSRMALDRERKMLSKKVHKKFTRKEREKYYLNWGIDLKSKHRSIQLAWRVWTNTKDMDHLRESATLVAKLIGLVESNEAQKKTFGLNFLALFKSPKSHSWEEANTMM